MSFQKYLKEYETNPLIDDDLEVAKAIISDCLRDCIETNPNRSKGVQIRIDEIANKLLKYLQSGNLPVR